MRTVALQYAVMVAATVCALTAPGFAEQPDEPTGYPRPFSFREINPKNLPYLEDMAMVVSDLHLRTRQGADHEFKQRHPSRPLLIQINTEGLGLWGTWICLPEQRLDDIGLTSPLALKVFDELNKRVHPVMDFPGYWVYEAGAHTTEMIPAEQEMVTVGVTDTQPFEPSSHPHSVNRLKFESFEKDIVICPRDADGNLEWLEAEFGSVLSVDAENKTVQVRRWRTRQEMKREHATGTYLAPNANQIVLPAFPDIWNRYLHLREIEYYTPFLPNVTQHCPVDPRTGLNAAQWLARHWIDVKGRQYPAADGYVFDVSAGTFHPSNRISSRSDCDVDGKPDYFYFEGLDHWALGMFDFFSYLRDGVTGKFEGLGEELVLVSDANTNEEARFFDLLNGAEYEFGTVNPFRPLTHKYSSNLEHGVEPAPDRKRQTTWKTFIKSHWDVLAAIDFTTIEVWTKGGLVTYYLLFVMEVATRRVHFAGCTPNPNGHWMKQIARNLTDCVDGFLKGKRYLLMDRDGKFCPAFKNLLECEGVNPVPLPPRSPDLNAHQERFFGSLKSECLERMIFFGERSLRNAVGQFLLHYHAERNHQGLCNKIIDPSKEVGQADGEIECHERLGGLLRYYHRSAA